MRSLPVNRVVLEQLHMSCAASHAHAVTCSQRDEQRAGLIRRLTAGELTRAQFNRIVKITMVRSQSQTALGYPEDDQLYPYLDRNDIAIGYQQFEWGFEAAEEGRRLALTNPTFFSMYANGLDAMAQGQRRRVRALGDLLERIRAVLEAASALADTEIPHWDPQTLKLQFRGVEICKFRSAAIAKNVHEILGRFELASWRVSVEIPAEWLQKTLHETVRTLNKRQLRIRFSGHWAARAISREILAETTTQRSPSDRR